MLTPELAQRYLQSCEIALQRCQQRLEYDGPGSSGDVNIMEAPESMTHGPMSTLEQHLQRILGHLNTMHTISSVAWRQRLTSRHLVKSPLALLSVNHVGYSFSEAQHTFCDIVLFNDKRRRKRITSGPALSTISLHLPPR